MSTLEATVSMLEMLPESDLIDVQEYIFKNKIKSENPFQPLGADQILSDLEMSREQYKNGQYMNMQDAVEEIRDKYGL